MLVKGALESFYASAHLLWLVGFPAWDWGIPCCLRHPHHWAVRERGEVHYNDVTWALRRLKSLETWLFVQHRSRPRNNVANNSFSYCYGFGQNHSNNRSISQSHNALDKYSTMHHFVTKMCTGVHISVTKWCIVGLQTKTICLMILWLKDLYMFISCVLLYLVHVFIVIGQ